MFYFIHANESAGRIQICPSRWFNIFYFIEGQIFWVHPKELVTDMHFLNNLVNCPMKYTDSNLFYNCEVSNNLFFNFLSMLFTYMVKTIITSSLKIRTIFYYELFIRIIIKIMCSMGFYYTTTFYAYFLRIFFSLNSH